jgi:hypothetical protein
VIRRLLLRVHGVVEKMIEDSGIAFTHLQQTREPGHERRKYDITGWFSCTVCGGRERRRE